MKKNSKKFPLSLAERERIAVYNAQGKSSRAIGELLGRSHTTVSRELRRNNKPHPLMTGYIAHLAHQQAKLRKQAAGRRPRLKSELIREYVQEKLRLGWTPEQIAGRLRLEHRGLKISYEAVYQYIYTDFKEGIKYLVRRHPKRYPKHYSRKRHKLPIPNRKSVSERSKAANERRTFGHWESDSLESCQSRWIINVKLERKSRLIKLDKVSSKHAEKTHQAISNRLVALPKKARKSITYDNGTENYYHCKTNTILGTKSYFCEPYRSWEKGAVENINGLIRRFIPKKTDLFKITLGQLQQIEYLLNNRPRKCLGFRTPNEIFYKYCVY